MSTTAPAIVRLRSAVPQFTVPDLIRTTEHYRDVLGFQVAGYWDGQRTLAEPPEDGSAVFAIVWRDDVQVFFNRGDGSAVRTGRADGAYDLYIDMTGVAALANELRSRGAEIVSGPEDTPYGQRELVVRDCNGLVVAFGEAT